MFETLLPWLVPGAALLAPLTDRMADWNGLLNMVLAGIANGLVYAVVFVAGRRTARPLVAPVRRLAREARDARPGSG